VNNSIYSISYSPPITSSLMIGGFRPPGRLMSGGLFVADIRSPHFARLSYVRQRTADSGVGRDNCQTIDDVRDERRASIISRRGGNVPNKEPVQ